jgi:hypothetical protein
MGVVKASFGCRMLQRPALGVEWRALRWRTVEILAVRWNKAFRGRVLHRTQ